PRALKDGSRAWREDCGSYSGKPSRRPGRTWMLTVAAPTDLSRRLRWTVTRKPLGRPVRKTCSTVKRRLISDLPGSYGAQSVDDSDLVPSPHSHSTAGQ